MNPNPDHSNSLLQYVIRRLKDTSLFEVVSKAVKYIRRSFLVSRILRYTAAVVVFLETSAILLAAFSVFLVTVPAAAVVLLACFYHARQTTVALARSRMKQGSEVLLLLADSEEPFPSDNKKILRLNPSLPALLRPPMRSADSIEVNAVFLFTLKHHKHPYRILKKESEFDRNEKNGDTKHENRK